MNRRRISVALVAATASALALVTPAQAEESIPTQVPEQQESQAPETPDEETADEDEATAEDEGSSFMGPDELLRSILGGHGSSGAPEDRESGNDEDEDEVELPEWAASAEMPLTIIGTVLSVGAAVAQAAAILLPIMPGGMDMLRDTLRDFGITVPADNA